MSGWIISHRITDEEVVKLLRRDVKSPLAVVVIGGNDERKDLFCTALAIKLHGTIHEILNPDEVTSLTPNIFDTKIALVVDLARGTSASHSTRRRVVEQLRSIGAKTIAVVWVRGNRLRDNDNARSVEEALQLSRPTAATEDVDYLFELEP